MFFFLFLIFFFFRSILFYYFFGFLPINYFFIDTHFKILRPLVFTSLMSTCDIYMKFLPTTFFFLYQTISFTYLIYSLLGILFFLIILSRHITKPTLFLRHLYRFYCLTFYFFLKVVVFPMSDLKS